MVLVLVNVEGFACGSGNSGATRFYRKALEKIYMALSFMNTEEAPEKIYMELSFMNTKAERNIIQQRGISIHYFYIDLCINNYILGTPSSREEGAHYDRTNCS